MSGFIAVHCGAGYHKSCLHEKYNKLCKTACYEAGKVLHKGESALSAVEVAIKENDPVTNAGFGSNLTINGDIECDASVMDGETLHFGACGYIQGVKNPVSLASHICKEQSVVKPMGLIPPMLLVGPGAYEYAKSANLKLIDNKKLISKHAKKQFYKNKRIYLNCVNTPICLGSLDTVGAVCVDNKGHVAAACSSGGIILKNSGRLGQAAVYGCGVWADSFDRKENAIAVTTTGTGEYLIKTGLAKELASHMKNSSNPVVTFRNTFNDQFLKAKCLQHVAEKSGGALTICVSPTGHGELIWGHSTPSMSIGYYNLGKKSLSGLVSKLPDENEFMMRGRSFKLNIT